MHSPLRFVLCGLLAATALTACSHSEPVQSYEFTGDRFATWTDEDPGYRLFPGDELDIVVYAAPDGRLLMPYAQPIMAGNKTIRQVERELAAALAGVVKNPDVQITPKTFQSQKIFIGGEVRNPGSFDMPGQIDVLQALTMAGGATERAKPKQALLIRRSPDGRPMMRVIDVASGLKDVRLLSNIPLQRFDILYVPRSPLANAGIVMDQVRAALPITFGTYYSLNGN